MKINTLSDHLKSTYGTKVYKLSLSSGCTCPNRDGMIGTGGCTFCSEGGSGDFAAAFTDIDIQIAEAKKYVDSKFPKNIRSKDRRYIAYFQSYTNTYGDPERLKKLFLKAASHPEIVAISIGTRPDCLGPLILDMLTEVDKEKPVWVELGLQTIHKKTADHIRRGYPLETFERAYDDLKKRNFKVIVHVILGLPGETKEDMLETVQYLAGRDPVPDGIKLQLLHILKGTALAEEYEESPFHILSLDEYCDIVVDCLKILPKETVIHRLTGDGPKRLLIEPRWSADKKHVLNMLNKAIAEA
ncbi:MAG: TIGR01212 family radical SAM protein [Lachnospiraceae bacterium]|jgi:radical SAM protein (TIGR01212 family)|nr:TIGR01212 family radical SAM protein [Lachnospiraceae bacterium]MEE3460829.1 TIGR01212 family radical SAM protein [Lachnospiraceae bacterium]